MEAHIRVAARLRPLTPNETRSGCVESIYAFPETKSVSLGPGGRTDKSFGFDFAFPAGSANGEVYETCVAPLLQEALKGYNVTIFAYGQVCCCVRLWTRKHDGRACSLRMLPPPCVFFFYRRDLARRTR